MDKTSSFLYNELNQSHLNPMSKKSPAIVAVFLFLLIIAIASILFIKQQDLEKNQTATGNVPVAPVVKDTQPAQVVNQAPIQKVQSIFDPKNCSYNIDNRNVLLKDGQFEQEIVPGSATKEKIDYFGNEAKGDLNGDGKDDAIVILTQDAGGTGVFYYVVAALNSDKGCVGTNSILLGDRIAPQNNLIDGNGVVIVNYGDRKPEEPMITVPSVGVSRYFKVIGNLLVEIK